LFILVFKAKKERKFAFLFVVIYAFSDEIHQSFVPTREPTLRDIIIDCFGGSIGWRLTFELKKLEKNLKNLVKFRFISRNLCR
jgi:VanZ family protein